MNEISILNESTAKPYPRRCSECGRVAVHPGTLEYAASIKHDGKLHEFKIPQLPIDRCEECKNEYFTNRTSDAKSAALRRHLSLLRPDQIRDLLAKNKLSQRKFASHLRIAEESVSRWINGLTIQSRALDTFMRIYFARPEVRALLASHELLSINSEMPIGSKETIGGLLKHFDATTVHPVFGRRFAVATITRSQRFQLVPSGN